MDYLYSWSIYISVRRFLARQWGKDVNMEDAIKRATMDLYSKYIDAPRCARTEDQQRKDGVLLMHRDDYKEMIDNGGGAY